MEKITFALFLFFLTLPALSDAQIITNEKPTPKPVPKEEVKPEPKEVIPEDTVKPNYYPEDIALFFEFSPTNTNPYLQENPSVFGKPLGERANERAANIWSFALGFRAPMGRYFAFQSGISVLRNAEEYDFSGVDTSFSYRTTYTYLAMPLKVYFEFGNRVRGKVGAGVIPQMLNGYSQKQEWTTSLGNRDRNTVTSRNGLSSFVVSATVSAGVSFRYSENISLYFVPEYRMQLNSTYLNEYPYIHKVNAFALSFGLYYHL